jgi:phospholipase/carboxylesterase
MTKPVPVKDWPHLFVPGSQQTIITLHGFGGNESEVSALASWLDPNATVLSPRGQKTLDGAHYWYGQLGDSGFAPDDIEHRASELHRFLGHAAVHYGFDLDTSVIAGFSNGAAMALALAIYFPETIHTVAAFSGTLPFSAPPEADLSGTTLWFSHGDADPWVSKEASEWATKTLTTLGPRLETLIRPGAHTISEEEIVQARKFLFS